MTKNYLIILICILSMFACQKNREIKHSGFDDLMVGSETINLYNNGEFSIEIGLGYQEGTYKIKEDTVLLTYNQTVDLPQKFLLRDNKFESIDFSKTVTIRRTDKNKSEIKLRRITSSFDQKKEFQIKKIVKSNDYPSSERDTTMCEDWNLKALGIKSIIKRSKSINGSEWHHLFDHLPCRVHGTLIQDTKEFEYSINSGAWLTVRSADTTLMFGNFEKENDKYFLSTPWSEEDMDKN